MKRHVILSLAGGVAGAAMAGSVMQASAADLPQPPVEAQDYSAPVPNERFYWAGFYFGGNLGGTMANRDANGAATGAFGADSTGFSGGVQGGYNYMLSPNFLVGAEADFTFADVDEVSSPAGIPVRASLDWMSSFRGRVGWTFDRFLVYGTGGVALADVNWKSAGVRDSATAVGYTVGGGVEAAVQDNLTARVEYLYTDFGKERFNLGGGTSVTSDLDVHTARVGLNYKF